MDACVYRGEGENEVEIEVEVEGSLEPYFAGSYEEPPSGGGIDDLRVTTSHAGRTYEIPLTDKEEADFAEALAESAIDDEPEYDEPEYEKEDYDDRF